ncbi:3'(2'),5'-bisphosphate nucleotidase CysQ [Thermomonas sp.]|uniref:3'(2'),5'-bisphosphate nucleotidase CysQ n=1 Tax=Thermomonas sp. TaxID=1971895 RepID=UPI002489D8E8|nr:3'(2'),5'-bisphosphate nucleotidase CysQ [Thermomonas sp.]MDI1254383.1 3'(2'),5'-bisphosphate nucleotidase CysQ [Thermomonas sp.]
MTMTCALRDLVIAIARQAAADILEVYQGAFDVEHKDDRSPLTAADLASHRRIVAGLQALTPEIPVLSEESKSLEIAQRRTWPRFWLVDPLDGTREFIKRNGEFTVNIALIEDGVATFGVIQQPVGGGLWHGMLGAGAFRRDGDIDAGIHVRKPANAPLRIAASRSHRDARTQALLDVLTGSEAIACGSSLKFCRIAEGELDLYPRFGPTSEWDTAAGQAILEAAGGAVLDPCGRPFRYNQRDTLLNGDFIAFGDVALRDSLPA